MHSRSHILIRGKGSKNKPLGRYVYENFWEALLNLSMSLSTGVLQWSREEIVAECRKELKMKDQHYYADWYENLTRCCRFAANLDSLLWYAQKPEDASIPLSRHAHVQNEEHIVIGEDDEADDTVEVISLPCRDTGDASTN